MLNFKGISLTDIAKWFTNLGDVMILRRYDCAMDVTIDLHYVKVIDDYGLQMLRDITIYLTLLPILQPIVKKIKK